MQVVFWKAFLYAEIESVFLNIKFTGNQMITESGGQREKYELKEKIRLVVTYKGGETGKTEDY